MWIMIVFCFFQIYIPFIFFLNLVCRLGFSVQCLKIIMIVVILDFFVILNGMFLTFALIQFCYRYFVAVFIILTMYSSIPSWLRLYHKQLFYQMLWSCEVFSSLKYYFDQSHWSIFLFWTNIYIPSMTPNGLHVLPVLYIAEFSLLVFCLAVFCPCTHVL